MVCYYREDKFAPADEETRLRTGDEVVILTHSKNLSELEKRWLPKQQVEEPTGSFPVKKSKEK